MSDYNYNNWTHATHNKGGSQILQTQGAVALITELLDSL
jgi:hypothetical protein